MKQSGKLYITINRRVIDSNRKHGRKDPPIRVVKGKYGRPTYCSAFEYGNLKIVYKPNGPLPCGARVWIEVGE